MNKTALQCLLSGVSWLFLLLSCLLTACIAGWVLLGAILLYGTQLLGVIGVIGFGIFSATMAWLVGRFFSSPRIVGSVVGALFTILSISGAIWSWVNPDKSLYLGREMVWSAANVWDYQRYPQRMINSGSAKYYFPINLSPDLFRTIEFPAGSQGGAVNFDEFLQRNHTTSFIVVKDGIIRYEKYFNGFDRDSIVPSFSMAKSFVSALVGIAIDEESIGSLDDAMVTYLPELKGRGLDEVTLRHLISMSSGIRCTRPEDQLLSIWPFNDKQMAYSYPNLRGLALSATTNGSPLGKQFDYCDYNPLLLGLILERMTNRTLSDYLAEKIWQPLGMEYPGSWDLDSLQDGFEKTEVGINGRAIDFAKFGQLMLNQGSWEGRQVIPQAWVVESTSPIVDDRRPYSPSGSAAWKAQNGYAKYLWWGKLSADGTYTFMAWGAQGEFIFIAPQERAVVVRFGIDQGFIQSWPDIFEAVVAKLK